MKVRIEKIGPRKAQEYLLHNKCNRPLRTAVADGLRQMMENGRYIENGDPIRFDSNGNLIDGQHRLTAVVMSGKTYNFVVVRELIDQAYQTIDRQSRRSLADTFHHFQVPNYAAVSATCKKILVYAVCSGGKDFSASNRLRGCGATDENYLAFIKECPEVLHAVELISPHNNMLAGRCPGAIVMACQYLFTRAGYDDQYWVKFAALDGIKAGTAAHRLQKIMQENTVSRTKVPGHIMFWLCIQSGIRDMVVKQNEKGDANRKKRVQALVLPATAPEIKGLDKTKLLADFGL